MTDLDRELVDLYADERPGMAWHVVAAFVEAGVEPPDNDRVRSVGFSAAEANLLDKYYERHDPYNGRAQHEATK